jgi:hypothetical protein
MSQNPLIFVLPALLALNACTYGDHTSRHDYDDNRGNCGGETERGIIDTDQMLDVEAGSGVGVFVEYQTGGHWRIFVACDTEKSGLDCAFDIIAQPVGSSPITSVRPEGLERDDSLSLVGGDLAELVTRTDLDFDGFSLDTKPGAVLSVDAYLDGACTNYVYWVGDGAVHDGAPSNPIEFEPSAD